MNPEKIHDALTLLPNDLIAATDRLRSARHSRRIHWVRWASLAACAAILACSGLMLKNGLLKTAKTESAAQAPAEAPAAAVPLPEVPAAEVAEEAAPAPESNIASDQSTSATGETDDTAAPAKGHNHTFADTEELVEEPASGYCGNAVTVIYIGGKSYSLSGSDSVVLTDILINLDYDPEKWCNCAGEFTVDTEFLTGIEVNLADSYARCERGQANLTEEQSQTIQDILNRLT